MIPESARISMSPIGIARTPFKEKVAAPRQAVIAHDTPGTIELLPEYEHAMSDLEGFDRIWVLYWFHQVEGWRAKVLPPRSERRRGVLATRSPHRPNPIGLSCVRLVRTEGLSLHILDVDMVDETPILDIKPYVPYADAFPDAGTGWLEQQARDPIDAYAVLWSAPAKEQAMWLRDNHGIDLITPVEAILAVGPQPHPYRRIKKVGLGLCLAHKEWRIFFHLKEPRSVLIESLATGYRPSQLQAPSDDESLHVHRTFLERFQK